MNVKLISDQDYPVWDNYVQKHPTANFFHRIAWLKVIQNSYGHKPLYLIAMNEDVVSGVLPLFLVSRPLFGRVLASDVFASYGGICADSEEVETALMSEAARLAGLHKVSYLEIKNSKIINGLGSEWHTKTDYCTLIFDLTPGPEGIWKAFKHKVRYNARMAEKAGVEIEHGSHLLDSLYENIAISMRRLGTPVHSKAFYKNMIQQCPEDVTLFVAKVSGKCIGSAITVGFKDQIQLLTYASDSNYWHLKPNEFMYWKIIQYAHGRGYKYLDFGRSKWDSGTFNFKKHIGADPVPLYYQYALTRARSVPDVSQDNPKYQLAIRCWQHLPLGITKTLGPHLIKYVV